MKNDNYDVHEDGRDEKILKGYKIIVAVLAVILVAISLYFIITKKQLNEMFQEERTELNTQITGFITDIDNINFRNDSVSGALRANISSERTKADSLMSRLKNERSVSRNKLRQYERELGTLRTIMRRYIGQIDSLNVLNRELASQNINYRKTIATETTRADAATERANELSDKIRLGSVVKVQDIVLSATSKRGKNVTRASRAALLKVDMALTSNDLTIPGERSIYMRIIGPDGIILTNSTENIFEYEGDMITYSALRDVDYQNQDLEVSVFFNSNEIEKGVYIAELYMDGYFVGSAELSLR